MTLILAFSIAILSWSISFDDFIIFGFAADVGAGDFMKTGFNCWSSTLYPITSSWWFTVYVWSAVASLVEGPSPKAFLSACLSKWHYLSTNSALLRNRHLGVHALHSLCFFVRVKCCKLCEVKFFGALYFDLPMICYSYWWIHVDANVYTYTLGVNYRVV